MTFSIPESMQKDYDRLLERLKTDKKDKPFYMHFVFPNEECLADFLEKAHDNGVKKLGFSGCDSFGANRTLWLCRNLHRIPDLEFLNLNECNIGQKGASALIDILPKTQLKGLSMNFTVMKPKHEQPFLDSLRASKLEDLSVAFCSTGNREFAGRLADLLPETNIRRLNMEGMVCPEASLIKMVEALPRTKLTALQMGYMSGAKGQNMFIDILPELGLTDLNLKCCYDFKEPEATRLMRTLPNTKISNLYYSASSRFSRGFFEEAARMMTTPSCRLEKVNITMFGAPQEYAALVHEARNTLKQNVSYRTGLRQKAEANATVTDVPPGMPLGAALEEGLLKQALDARPPLTGADLTAADKDGVTFAAKAARAEVLPLVFSPKYWDNAREMQNAWIAVGRDHHWQLDGRHDRPSFRRVKNEVAGKAIKSLLSAKGKGRA